MVALLTRIHQLRPRFARLLCTISGRLLEHQQGLLLPLFAPAFGQQPPELVGPWRHLHHVQGSDVGTSKRPPQIRALLAEHTHLYVALRPQLYHCDDLILRPLHVWLPEVYGLCLIGEGQEQHRVEGRPDLIVVLLLPLLGHVRPHRLGRV